MSTQDVRKNGRIIGKITDNGNERIARDSGGSIVATYNKTANNTRIDGRVVCSGDNLEEILEDLN